MVRACRGGVQSLGALRVAWVGRGGIGMALDLANLAKSGCTVSQLLVSSYQSGSCRFGFPACVMPAGLVRVGGQHTKWRR